MRLLATFTIGSILTVAAMLIGMETAILLTEKKDWLRALCVAAGVAAIPFAAQLAMLKVAGLTLGDCHRILGRKG